MAPRSNPILRRNVIAAAGHDKLQPSAAVEKADETRRYDFREMSEALSGAEKRIKKRSNPILRSSAIAAADHQKLEPSAGDEKADETRRYDFREMSEALSGAELRIKKRPNPIIGRNLIAAADHQKLGPSATDEKALYYFWEKSRALAEMRIKNRWRLYKLKIRRMRYIELMCLRGKVSVSDTYNQAVPTPRSDAGEKPLLRCAAQLGPGVAQIEPS